jgi:hypothetical protein
MSGLPFTTGLCQGWVVPGGNFPTPNITYMSGTYSPAGGTTLIAIFGTNFRLYSTIKFGTYTPTMIFINSGQIDFYVPTSAKFGIYPVQVFNDVYGSNIVNYTIEDTPGFWYLNPPYSNVISNSNNGGLSINGTIVINNTIGPPIGVSNLEFPNYGQAIRWPNGIAITTDAFNNGILIDGDLTVTGTITPPPSDYRIKDIIEPLNVSYTVDNLKPIRYFNNKSKREEIGFLAHEVQEKFPCLVTGEKDGPDIQTLNYVGLIGVLVQEIQQLKADVKKLKEGQAQ